MACAPTHWTYASHGPSDDIQQGDILYPTDNLKSVFATVHPHFNSPKYLAFLVATQSCDLVRRNGTPRAPYVNLAAVRPLAQVISRVLSSVIRPVVEGVFKNGDKLEAKRFLSRLINQNEQNLGLFFLYPDADAGIGEAAVAFLRVTVALRAEHYDALQSARRGRLVPEFRAKLGWLLGNLYARPATEDWQDREGGKKRFEQMVKAYLADARWLDDEIVDAAKTQGVDIPSAAPELLESLRPPPRLERALAVVQKELEDVAPGLSTAEVRSVINVLRNNRRFAKLLRGTSPG